jgi:hypothetical protein
MAESGIRPESITRPIQLLAAWLAGLVAIDGSFLFAASHISTPSWAAGVLVISSTLNVPIFIVAVFLLQTKFRPEMQEDSYYAQYLDKKYSSEQGSLQPLDISHYAQNLALQIQKSIGKSDDCTRKLIEKVIRDSRTDDLVRWTGRSRTLSELHIRPALWPRVVHKWRNSKELKEDADILATEGLLITKNGDIGTAALTDIGKTIAALAEKEGRLWSQMHKTKWESEGFELEGPIEIK